MQQKFYSKQLILLGGGHSNIQVLKKLCMNEYIGLQTILISENYDATYSGLTPAYLQNQIKKSEISIDLQRLCFNAGATFIKDRVVSLDAINQSINLQNHPSIDYDLLSINTGSISKKVNIKTHDQAKIIMVKPINLFVEQIEKIDKLVNKNENAQITIIGNGIAGYEICFSLYQRYKNKITITLVGSKDINEKNINSQSKRKLKAISKMIGIVEKIASIKEIGKNEIFLSNSEIVKSDINFLSTGASAPMWLNESLIKTNSDGFALVNNYLQSLNFENIFITGDIASSEKEPRPKSGVMAVRQGEILKENIFFKLQGKPLNKYNPQKNWLYIVNTLNKKALINYYFLSFHGKWCLKLKFHIDNTFMNKFKFPDKTEMKKKVVELKGTENQNNKMYCQGCGSKVSKNTLVNFLKKEEVNHELSDVSAIETNSSSLIQSIDHIKLFSSLNPFDFGVISYLHSQNDILSGGGSVKSLSVSLALPFSEGATEKFYMDYFMKGIQSESNKDKSIIASGHSFQSIEPGITITMNGAIEEKLSKNQAQESDLIYLSKPLGTGYLLAAYFKNTDLLTSDDFQYLINCLKTGNKEIAQIAKKYHCNVMTDISGFGLASHLGDICKSSNLTAKISLNSEILINSNINILNKYQSTGFKNNYLSSSKEISISEEHLLKNILYDPQTNGPLLFSINKDHKDKFETEIDLNQGFKPIFLGKFTRQEKKLIYIDN